MMQRIIMVGIDQVFVYHCFHLVQNLEKVDINLMIYLFHFVILTIY